VRFAIYGSGGLGGYYGARLHDAGHDVGFIARGANLEAMRSKGLQILSPLGDLHIDAPTVSDKPAEIGEVDFVLVAVKTWQIPEVAEAMRPMIAANTLVVPFLNGVDAPYQLADALGQAHVLGGLSRIFSLIEAPGVIRHFNDSAYVGFGTLDNQPSVGAQALREAFAGAGVDAEVTADVVKALWEKLILVASWSGLAALARCSLGGMREDLARRQMVDTCIDESIAVARARGAKLDADYKQSVWKFYESLPESATSSMMRDIWTERPSEVDAWCGVFHRIGAEVGVPTPTHTFCYQLLQAMEAAARAS
jgi:2-dehydropantoate 2-reductase